MRSPGLPLIVLALVARSPVDLAAQSKRPAGEQWDQVRPLFALVEEVASGRTPPADGRVKWQCHFLDAEAGVVFVPFTVQVPEGTFAHFPVAMYLRVVLRGAPAPAPGPTDALAQYPFEDAAMFESAPDGRFSRGFTAPPGEYDVYVALREPPAAAETSAEMLVLKQPVRVPDLKSEFSTSSIIVAEKIDPDPSPGRLDFEAQLDHPYVWWGTRLTPALRHTFRRSERLALTFAIYNAGIGADDKPDVAVEYHVHAKSASGEAFFNRTTPEIFNAATLPRDFQTSRGDLLVAGRQIPLAPFPDGEYRLEVRVIDRTNGKTLTRDVHFTVSGT